MSGLVFSNKTSKWLVFSAFCIALCGCKVTKMPDSQSVATTGLEDVFAEARDDPCTMTIKNISLESNDKDDYYLNWIFDNGDNDDIQSTIDVHVKTDGPMYFFRHFKHIRNSGFYKIDIGKLEKCHVYNVTLQAHNKLSDSDKYHFSFETNPGPVKSIEAESETPRSISVSWFPPEDDSCVTGYTLKISSASGFENIEYLPTDVLNHEYTELLPCTNYKITIFATSNEGDGIPSPTQSVHTKSLEDLRPVSEIVFEELEGNLLVEWTPLPEEAACITGYIVQIDDGEEFPQVETTYTIINVDLCKKYTVTVKPTHDAISGEERKGEYTTRAKDLGPVSELTFAETGNDLVVEWTPLPEEAACITGYIVQIDDGEEFPQVETTYTIINVDLCKKYTVTVKPTQDAISGEERKGEYTTRAKDLGPVSELTFAETGNDLVVEWTPLPEEAACITGYIVQIDDGEEFPQVENTHTITNVDPCKKYTVTVKPTQDAISGEERKGEYTTRAKDLGPVSELTFKETGNDLLVEWTPSPEEAACITGYIVQIDDGEEFPQVETTYTIINVDLCKKYTVTVKPTQDAISGEEQKGEYTSKAKDLGPVSELTFAETGNDLVVEWTPLPEEAACITGYIVQIDDGEEFPQVENTHTITNVDPCKKYTVTVKPTQDAISGEERKGEYTTRAKDLGPVSELTFKETGNDLLVEWTPLPEEAACITGYIVQIDDGEEFPQVETTYTIINVDLCKKYTVTVKPTQDAISGEERKGEYTSKAKDLGPVSELTFAETGNDLVVEWTPLPEEAACITGYIVQIDDGEEVSQQENTYTITNVDPCKKYTVTVKPTQDAISGEERKGEYTTRAKDLGPVSELTFAETGNDLVVEWTPLPEEAACITGYIVQIDDGEEVSQQENTYTITNVDMCKKYTVTVKPTQDAISGEERKGEYTTRAKDLGPVSELTFKETGNDLLVEWTPLPEEEACITGYIVQIDDGEEVSQQENTYIISNTEQCKIYTVTVKATSDGEARTGAHTIQPTAHNLPNIEPDVSDPEVNKIKFKITTDTSAENACELTDVEINCDAKADDNEATLPWIVKNQKHKFPVSDIAGRVYILELADLSIYTNYTCKAISYVMDQQSPPSVEVKASTILISTKPENITFTNTDSRSFTVEWESFLPKEEWDHAIKITTIGPNYYVPVDCAPGLNMLPGRSNTLSFAAIGLAPSYKYKVAVRSNSWLGVSEQEESVEVITNGEAPGQIRKLEVKEIASEESAEFKNTMQVIIDPPCNLASTFEAYKISFKGTRINFPDYEGAYEIKNENGLDDVQHILRAEYAYVVTAFVKTETGESVPIQANLELTSGAGVPIISQGATITPPNDDSMMSFSPDVFSNENGEIKYFAILLSVNYDFDKDYGYLKKDEWPDVGEYTNGYDLTIEPYQITPRKWDPRTGTPTQREGEGKLIEFEVGTNESCTDLELCNGALRGGTKYTITVRGLTNGGYRDIRADFDTADLDDEAISLGVILGITFGVIFTCLIFLGSYIFYRKRTLRSSKNMASRTGAINNRIQPGQAGVSERYNMHN